MIRQLTSRLSAEQQEIALQFIRFGFSGGVATAISLVIYYVMAVWRRDPPQLANFLAYVAAVIIGYMLHSRFSFRGHGTRDSTARTTGRFVVTSLVSYALNAFWVWLFTHPLGWPRWSPMAPMLFVTPLATFALNRRWVFA